MPRLQCTSDNSPLVCSANCAEVHGSTLFASPAQGKYLEKGYVSREQTSVGAGVPGLPFLIAVVVALFGALGYVVSQTS